MEVLKNLFASKKAVIAIVGLILEGCAASGLLNLDESVREAFMQNVAVIAGSYFVGQGAADFAKEKARVEKEN